MKKYLIPTIITLLLSAIFLSSCSGGSKPDQTSGGVLSDFTSEDLSGNPVDQSVFSEHKLTMVNIWATFCGPCIREMPDLGELNREYADKGFQIIGIPADITDSKGNVSPSMLAEAISIVSETGADYLHIMPSASLVAAKLKFVYSVPETIFVDEFGRQVGESYIGSRSKADWIKIIDELLKEVG